METQYRLRQHDTLQILEVNHLLTEFHNRKILQTARRLIDAGFTTFVVDLKEMRYTNSVGLNFLIALHRDCRAAGGQLLIVNVAPKIKQLLEITKLKPILQIQDSLESALDFLAKQAHQD
jgi:anti-sigma B factor antagonist